MFSKVAVAMCLSLSVSALVTPEKAGSEAAKKGRSVAVTGCLQPAGIADRFHIVRRDGRAYGLRSTSVQLAGHVGHTVTVKGELKRDPKRDDYDFEGSEINEEYGKDKITDVVDVEVTALKMLAASCK